MKKLNFYLFLTLFMSAMVMPATMQAKSTKHKLMRGIILEYDSLPGRATLTCGKTFVMTGHFDKICNTTVTDCKLIAKNFSRVINGTPQEGLTFEGEVAFIEEQNSSGSYKIKPISGKLKLGNYELSNIKDTYFTLRCSDWNIYNLKQDVEWWENVSSSIDDKFWNSYSYEYYGKKFYIYEQLKGGSPKQASLFKHTRFSSNEKIKNKKLRIDYDNGAYIIYNLAEPYYSETIVITGIEYISLPNGDFYERGHGSSNNSNKVKITFTDAIVVAADSIETIDVPYNYYDGDHVQIKNLYRRLIGIANSDGSKYIGRIDVTIDNNFREDIDVSDLALAVFHSPKDLSVKDIDLKYRDGLIFYENGQEDSYVDCKNESERYAWYAKVKAENKKAIAEAKAAKAERERQETAFRQKMIKKYGEYWFNMANSGRVAVGMPEELVQHMNGIHQHGSRGDVYIRPYDTRNVGDPWKYDWIYINNGKVSYITTKYSYD